MAFKDSTPYIQARYQAVRHRNDYTVRFLFNSSTCGYASNLKARAWFDSLTGDKTLTFQVWLNIVKEKYAIFV